MTAEEYIDKYITKDQDDWLVQKKDIVAKFMEAYHKARVKGIRDEKAEATCRLRWHTKDTANAFKDGIKWFKNELLKQ